jgi:hypothetical protein
MKSIAAAIIAAALFAVCDRGVADEVTVRVVPFPEGIKVKEFPQSPLWPLRAADMDRVPLDAALAEASRRSLPDSGKPAVLEAGDRPRPVRTVPIAATAGLDPSASPEPLPDRSAALPSIRETIWEVIQEARAPAVRTFPVLERPAWTWPLQNFWWASPPGSRTAAWTWQGGWQPALPAIRIASSGVPGSALRGRLPSWVQDMSRMTVEAASTPSWRRVRVPDFRIPTEPTRLADHHLRHLVPPAQFVRWTDRLETVLPADKESIVSVDRRCRAIGAKSVPGRIIYGCAHHAAGRCFIIRVDDPGVARHELAHCNGWKHPDP